VPGPKVPHYMQTFRPPSESVRRSPLIAVDDSFTLHKSAESESDMDVKQIKSKSASDAVSDFSVITSTLSALCINLCYFFSLHHKSVINHT